MYKTHSYAFFSYRKAEEIKYFVYLIIKRERRRL